MCNQPMLVDSSQAQSTTQPLLLIGGDLRRDAIFFVPLGALFAVLQIVSFKAAKLEWGSDLLAENLSLKTFVITSILVVGTWVLLWIKRKDPQDFPRLTSIMSHIAGRVAAIGSVAATITTGFALIAFLDCNLVQRVTLITFVLFMICIPELAVGMWRTSGFSKLCPYLSAAVVGLLVWLQVHVH